MFLVRQANEYGVRYDSGSFLFGDGGHVFPFNAQTGLPAEYVRVET